MKIGNTDETDRPKIATFCRSGRVGFCTKIGLTFSFLLALPDGRLNALPPLDVNLLDENAVELSWPDTGEAVEVESSADLGNTIPWQLFPGVPVLQGGFFRLPVQIDPSGQNFFRLAEGTVDPTTPVFVDPPGATQTLFPGQTVAFTLAATDPGGLKVSFFAEPLPLPAGARLNMTTGEFFWKPTAAQTGTFAITFLAYNGSASGRLPITIIVETPPIGGETSLAGILLDTTMAVGGEDLPVVGATVSLLGTGFSTVTGADGRFLLQGIPGGKQVLDLATATAQPAPDGSPYAGFREALTIVEGVPNVVERPFYLPRLAVNSLKQVDPNLTTTVENPDLGVTLTVPPHIAMMGDEEFAGQLSISEVPEGLAPAALPENLDPGLLITIQPVGVIFDEPVPITFPNTDGLAPGSETDLWSLDPDLGEFVVVGKGRVSDDGTRIETFEGGVRAADWHAVLPPDPTNGPPPDGPPPCEDDCCEGSSPPPSSAPPFAGPLSWIDSKIGPAVEQQTESWQPRSQADQNGYIHFSSQVSPASGALRTWLELPPYESLGVERSLAFFYNSNQAYPYPLVPVNGEISVRAAVPPKISARLRLAGVDCGIEAFMATTGFSESRDEPFRMVTGFDASAWATGVYPYSMKLSSHYVRSTVSADISSEVILVNRRGSPFGNGWGLAGLQRVHGDPESPTGIIVTDGSGAADRYSGSLGRVPFTIGALGSAAVGELSLVEGSVFQDARAALADSTEAVLVALDDFTAASIASIDVVFVTPYRSATEGRALSAEERADILAFVRGGGCVVATLDHTLGRSSFAAAVDSIAGLFQVEAVNAVEAYNGAPSGDILAGFFGTVGQVTRPFGGAAITSLGPWAEGIGTRDAQGFAGAFIRADSIIPGSGPAVLLPDFHAFLDDGGFGITAGSNRQLFLNSFGTCVAAALAREGAQVLRGVDGAIGTVVLDTSAGTLTRFLPDGSEIVFDASGLQRTISDPDGNVTTYDYAGTNLSRITDPVGRATTFAYGGDKLATITDPAGRITRFTFDGEDLRSVELPGGATRSFGYDSRSLMTSEIDTNGKETTRVYDEFGCILSADLPGGIHRELATAASVGIIDPSSGIGTEDNPAAPTRPEDAKAIFTDGAGRVKEYVFNPDGSPGGASDLFGDIARTRRDDDRNPIEATRSDGSSFTRIFDRLGRMVRETDNVKGGTTSYEYEGNSHYPSAIVDPLGRRALTEYEGSNLIRVESAAGRVWTASYDDRGLITEVTEPIGLTSTFEYDAAGNLLAVTSEADGESRRTLLTRDAAGRQATYTSPAGERATYEYNAMGTVSTLTAAGGREFGYQIDGEGYLTSITMPGGQQHTMTNGVEGQLLTYDFPAVGGNTHQLSYDLDGDGVLSAIRRPDGDDLTIVLDDAKRLERMESAAGAVTFEYAEADHPTKINSPGGVMLEYSFDGDLLTGLQWSGPIEGSVARSFDQLRQARTRTINGGAARAFEYNADGFMTRAGDLPITLEPDTGLPVSDQIGGVLVERVYNGFGELSSYAGTFDGTTVFSQEHTFDADGRVIETTETIEGTSVVREYEFDAAGRLATVRTDGTETASYEFDANSNRLSAFDEGAGTRIGTYDAQDRLMEFGGADYTYDDAGDLQSVTDGADTTTYDFDPLGNLRSVELPSGATIDYLIDGANRRIGKRVDGALVQGFLWQDRARIAAELDGSGAIVSEFVYAQYGVTPAYMHNGGSLYRILKDYQGSVRLVINTSSGEVAQRMDYDPWGRVVNDTNPGFQPFGYAGGVYDPDTGLLRFGAREYDPQSARWMTRDRLFTRTLFHNLYEYVGSDPVNYTDLTGFERCDTGIKPAAGSLGEARALLFDPSIMGPGAEEDREKYLCQYDNGVGGLKNLAITSATAPIRAPGGILGFLAKFFLLREVKREVMESCQRDKSTGSAGTR